MRKHLLRSVAALLSLGLLATLTACETEETAEEGGGTFDSGVSEDTTAAKDLSAEDQQAFCDSAEDYAKSQISEDEIKNLTCTIGGIFGASLGGTPSVEACQAIYDECLTQPLEEMGDQDVCSFPPDCEATVAEFEACHTEQIATLKDLAGSISCSAINDQSSLGPLLNGERGAACTALENKCPGIFDDEEENNADNNTPVPDPYRYVLITDKTAGASGDYPGIDLDAVGIVKAGGGESFASEVLEAVIGTEGNQAADSAQVVGAPDADCVANSGKFTALGGDGNYVVLGFEDGVTIEAGDTIKVYELGRTLCNMFDDDPATVSVSVSTDVGSFVEVGEAGSGTYDIVVGALP